MNKIINKFLLGSLFILISPVFFAQEIPIGDWRDHLPYNDAISVTYGNNTVYCATNSAVFTYDKTDKTIERLNLVNSLSDIGLNKIQFNQYNNKVIIAYKNGNIDVIDKDKNVTNIPFIKNSNIIGGKIINHIFFSGKLAYLSTGFGIVVLDTDKLEIVDTYLIGNLGSYLNTYSVAIDDTNIYAATDIGVRFANKNSVNLADFNNWNQIPELGNLRYNSVAFFSNKLFVCFDSTGWESDTIFYRNAGVWQKFMPNGLNVNEIIVTGNHLTVNQFYGIALFDQSLTLIDNLYTVNNWFGFNTKGNVIDEEGNVWIADQFYGLIKSRGNFNNEIITPNSPNSSNSFRLDFSDNQLWMVSGGNGVYLDKNLVNHKKTDGWVNLGTRILNENGNNALDMVAVAINPSNSTNVYVGSFSSGLYEYNNDAITNRFTAQSSILDSTFFGTTPVTALAFDANNNLWIVNSYTTNILSVKTPSNTWYNYSFPGLTSTIEPLPDMLIDQNNYKWIVSSQQDKLIIFDDNNTLDNKNDDRKLINNNVTGSTIECITEDLDGEIWVGTDAGISVFYNPSSVFDQNISAEQILIQQDGQTQILLETETVTAITIDGANRKWIGTKNSGVFLMSEDGSEQIEHFTTQNSPLFSNSIFDIVIDPKTGEVYFGTEKGLISYKGTATDANDDFNNIFVYPNPVKPDFTGTIAIRGLVKDTDVRITDISGNIVYQTTSLGGQAIWDGKDFNGNKVQTGVYMIFNGSPEGDKKAAAKILFLH